MALNNRPCHKILKVKAAHTGAYMNAELVHVS